MKNLTALPETLLEIEKKPESYSQVIDTLSRILPGKTWQRKQEWIQKGNLAKSVEFQNCHYALVMEDTSNNFIISLQVKEGQRFTPMANGDFKRVYNCIKNRLETLAKYM